MKTLLNLPTPSKRELHPLKQFLKDHPDAEYFTDELIAFDAEDNQIDRLENLPAQIVDYFDSKGQNGVEVVDNMGGFRFALDEIKEGNV